MVNGGHLGKKEVEIVGDLVEWHLESWSHSDFGIPTMQSFDQQEVSYKHKKVK